MCFWNDAEQLTMLAGTAKERRRLIEQYQGQRQPQHAQLQPRQQSRCWVSAHRVQLR